MTIIARHFFLPWQSFLMAPCTPASRLSNTTTRQVEVTEQKVSKRFLFVCSNLGGELLPIVGVGSEDSQTPHRPRGPRSGPTSPRRSCRRWRGGGLPTGSWSGITGAVGVVPWSRQNTKITFIPGLTPKVDPRSIIRVKL